jgi:hypothetical protein
MGEAKAREKQQTAGHLLQSNKMTEGMAICEF